MNNSQKPLLSSLDGVFLTFDWFQVTFTGVMQNAIAENRFLSDALAVMSSGAFGFNLKMNHLDKGMNGYPLVTEFVNDEGDVFARFLYGSTRDGMHVNAIASGVYAESMREVFLYLFDSYGYKFYITRADVALDFRGDFMSIYDELLAIVPSRVKTSQYGDYIRGDGGRTLYLGSRGGRGYVRFYEKGKEQVEKGVDRSAPADWLRFELEFRPERDERELVSRMSAEKLAGRIKWVRAMFQLIAGLGIESVGGVINRRKSDADLSSRLIWLCSHHKNTFRDLMEFVGGSMEDFADVLWSFVSDDYSDNDAVNRLLARKIGREERERGGR